MNGAKRIEKTLTKTTHISHWYKTPESCEQLFSAVMLLLLTRINAMWHGKIIQICIQTES